jgi:hypothetical protein
MNFNNPTPLRIGAKGVLDGRNFTVVGRVVLGMDWEGEKYYWNEFNLVDDRGESATLVYEEGENGPDWKLFTMFEPSQPMTVEEAAAKRVGDSVSLDGNPIRITLVDESEVYHIEGTAPEGVQEGDVADYFNAESAQRMIVVSWTGDEIEFYRGLTLGAGRVAAAFNLPRPVVPPGSLERFSGAQMNTGSGVKQWIIGGAVVLVAMISLVNLRSCNSSTRRREPLAVQPAPKMQLSDGAAGSLLGRTYTIRSHALVEVSRVGARFERHEYELVTESGDEALLVDRLDGKRGWHLLQRWPSPPSLSPESAAGLRLGEAISLDGRALPVQGMFQTRTLSCTALQGFASTPGTVAYGLVAQSADEVLVARWVEREIQCFSARELKESTVLTAFGVQTK